MSLIVFACILALFVWCQVWLHDQAKLIKACKHTRGELVPGVKDRRGRDTALIWMCKDCPFQIALKMLPVGKQLWIRQEDSDKNRDTRVGQDHSGEGTSEGTWH